MELSNYDIIKKRIVTPKSTDLFKKEGKITFEVHKNSNKIMIRTAVEKIWDVKVDNVRVISVPGKTKSFGRRPFVSSDRKKAIVTLKKGYKIDLPGNVETMGMSSKSAKEKSMPLEGK
ncbi:50S ribosomal protein L23 [Candidatus Dependentiae bacterium]|nr:50S ribosomal protein L23 [Candidatus Dependentiae bacterium]MBU4387581.1 50S ribosomal protein L23 [Candidatus Dependentiae bacterium]MCG2756297.1 50S ribosomal protein L23 [Candidatus Dependentiae bacterium]